MSAKTDSSLATAMNLIFAMAMTLKNMVWKKPLKTTSIVKKEIQVSPLETAIISKLCKLIDGMLNLQEFQAWFLPATWDIPKEKEKARAVKLVYTIKLRLGQYSDKLITKEELRERLIDLIL